MSEAPLMIERAFVGYKCAKDWSLLVRVCCTCPDRVSLESWCKARDLAMTHTYCPACYQAQLKALAL